MLKIVLVIALSTFLQGQIVSAAPLNVTVFYEALCPDSRRFFIGQLQPAQQLLANNLNVDLVPYGFANHSLVDSKYHFTCQHGPRECHSNLVQSCAIDLSTRNVGLRFVNCAFASSDAGSDVNLQHCAELNNLSWARIQECVGSDRGAKLLVAHGERTHSFQPRITFIPTIVFNGAYNQTLQNDSLQIFFATACRLLNRDPAICKQLP